MSSPTADRFRRWFWRPPRVHGDVILGRRVSSLELFYDLVYVVVISQATHQLALGITVRAVLDFTVIFSMISLAWVNGSLTTVCRWTVSKRSAASRPCGVSLAPSDGLTSAASMRE